MGYNTQNPVSCTNGDSSLYPQYEIWQIVGFPGDNDHNAYRDYYCELAI